VQNGQKSFSSFWKLRDGKQPERSSQKEQAYPSNSKVLNKCIMQRIKYMPYILFMIGYLCGGGVLCPNRPEERELSE